MRLLAAALLLVWSAAAHAQVRKTAPPKQPGVEQRAHTLREAGQLDEAARLYERALRAKPQWAEGWWYLGSIHYEADRWRPARDSFARLVQLEPKSAPGLAMLGLCDYQLGDYEGAQMALGRSRVLGIAANPQIHRVAIYHLGLLENRAGFPEVAIKTMTPLVDTEEQPSESILEAFGLAGLRRFILPAQILDADRPLLRTAGAAQIALAVREWPRAKEILQKLVAEYPNERGVHHLYGMYLLIREPDKAIGEFRRELEIAPNDIGPHLQLAFEFIRQGDYEQGLPHAEKAVAIDPDNFPARNALGRILMGLDRTDEAIAQLEAGVKLAPASPDMYFALGQAYTRAGRHDDAKRVRAEFDRLKKPAR